jgi:hypothetical protein
LKVCAFVRIPCANGVNRNTVSALIDLFSGGPLTVRRFV